MGRDRGALSESAATVQACGVGQPDFDPGDHPASGIVDPQGRLVPGSDAVAEGNAVAVFKAIGEDAGDQEVRSFSGMPGDAQVEAFADATIHIGEVNGEGENRGTLSPTQFHVSQRGTSNRWYALPGLCCTGL